MVHVLNIVLYDKNIISILEDIKGEVRSRNYNNFLISATGAHGIITAKKDPEFMAVLNSFYANLPDGMPGVWVGRLKGAKEMERCYGPDFFRETIIATKDENIKHFFCGGKEGVAEKLKAVCVNKFGNNNIVGVYSPPFREMSDDELKDLADHINKLGTNIVWVGLSTPKQEIFASRLSKFTKVNFICTVGAAFDFHTGSVKQAPYWIQRSGMEWFFRMIMEPKRLWKRYFYVVPRYGFYIFKEALFSLRKER